MSLTVQDGLNGLTRYFNEAGIDYAPREAKLILAHVMRVEPMRLTLMLRDELSNELLEEAYTQASRRKMGEPTSHILGYREFYGHRFQISSNVLDPRPETETLIEAALARQFKEVLDLGTGSGCILLTLLAERSDATGIGTDISPAALAIADLNASALDVDMRCGLIESNWFDAVSGQFDLIVANPPYIAVEEIDTLAPELSYEPRMALTDESDGLSAYRAITAGAGTHLTPGGCLMVEIGWTQGEAVAGMFRANGFDAVEILPDLDGRDRVVLGIWRR